MAWVNVGVAVVGLGVSAYQMSESKKAAGEASVKAYQNAKLSVAASSEKNAIDAQQRKATRASTLASVQSQNAQVEQLRRTSDIMGLQGKADATMMKEEYNQLASMQMVMGAASGRVMGSGGLEAVFDKSHEDMMWDVMWNKDSVKINQAALYQDMENIYEAGYNTLLFGDQALKIGEATSALELKNAGRGIDLQSQQAQTIRESSDRAATNSFINNFGAASSTLITGLGSSSTTKTATPLPRRGGL